MEFGVLGPLEVIAGDGTRVVVGGRRERAILARLLLSAGQVVPLEVLADDLWEGAPPEGAAQALWVYVSRLRKALRDHGGGGVLRTESPGYLLAVGPDALDSARFEALVGTARQSAAAGDPEDAGARFREALALWRGRALAEVADAPFARAEAARLEEARLAALEARIDADLACGRHGDLVGELAALTRDHPLRERFWAQRMVALYRAGRQAEALRAYQDLRRYLGEELGIEPSEELRRLEGAVLRHEPELDRRPTTASTPALPRGAVPEPGGVVAFLFTDLVDSTALLAELGDDGADELRRRHFSGLRQALAAHGGTEVKSLGDGLMAAFASPVAALRCALAIQETAGGAGGDDSGSPAVRVGVHAGEPISDGDDYFGTPVVVAQRLCARARGGQVLTSALVQGLVGNRAGCSFRGLGGLALKGLPEPVAACEVVPAAPAEAKTLPLPLPLERDDSTVFVGRDGELGHLRAAWSDARAGRHRLVLVAGEPGIGKTRLSAELARLAHDEGAAVLFGRCAEHLAVPYRPFLEALTGYLRHAPDPVLGRYGGELVRLVPELAERFGDLPPPVRSDPETERYRLFDAVVAWLVEVSAATPAVTVVDDLHWATRPTLDLLAHLVRSAAPLRLLVVATYRDSDLDVSAELADAVAELLRQPGVERIHLGGLDAPGIEAFVEAQARHDLDDHGRELAVALHAETGGNPFFVTQMLRHLNETGVVIRREGRWTTGGAALSEAAVPEGVRDVIARRLARLPDETRQVLAQAAVFGEQFDLAVLVHAAGQAEIATLRALDPALSARLVTEAPGPVPGYRFVHALVRTTLVEALPAADRLTLNHRAGAAIEAVDAAHLDEHLPALAHHYARAGTACRAVAGEYATRAGDRALAQYANDDAAAWYQQALEFLDQTADTDPHRRCDLLIALGEAQQRAGDPGGRQTLLDAAHLAGELEDSERLVRAALAGDTSPLSVYDPFDPERTAVLEAALVAAGPDDSPERARLLFTLALALMNSPWQQDVKRVLTDAIATARRIGNPGALAPVLAVGSLSLEEPMLADYLRRKDEMAAAATELGDPAVEFWGNFAFAMMPPTPPAATGAIETVQQLAAELSQPLLSWAAATLLPTRSRLAGRLDEAEALAHRAFDLGVSARRPATAGRVLRAQLFWIRYDQGRTGALLQSYARSAQGEDAHPWNRALLTVIYCEIDRLADARSLFDDLSADNFAAVPVPRLQVLAVLAKVCSDLEDAVSAALLYDQLSPHHELMLPLGTTVLDPVAHYLGLLATTVGRYDQAEQHFAEAAAIAQGMEAPTWLARTRLGWAQMLARRAGPGDADRARELAGAALASAEKLGMARVAAQAHQALA